jgi:FkbM family methyltransferase
MIRIAFVKFGGMAASGTERHLQEMARALAAHGFAVDFYWCDPAPYVGHAAFLAQGAHHAPTDPHRLADMERSGVRLIKFHVGRLDVGTPTMEWRDTDFWEVFDEGSYDFVQTAKAGPAEYPFTKMQLPIVEVLGLAAGVDRSPNICFSLHPSQWQRRSWWRSGGPIERSAVVPVAASEPATTSSLRSELGIPAGAIVAGFHQRSDDAIASEIPLEAFAKVQNLDRHFVIMGGGDLYRRQVQRLALENVHFVEPTGSTERVSAFLNTLDIFAHGRRDGETFGAVFAEAMMHGLPCLSHASYTGNNAQIETMGPGGLFAFTLDQYVRELTLLFDDGTLRERLGGFAATHARTYYSRAAGAESLVSLYRYLEGGGTSFRPPAMPYVYMEGLGFLYAGHPEEPGIAHFSLGGGTPEAFEVHIARFLLSGAKTVVDVGANTGLYCFVAAAELGPSAVIHAFEPQPECCEVLSSTVSLNRWQDFVQIHQVALSDNPGVAVLYLCGTGSTLQRGFVADNAPQLEVPLSTLDSQADQLGLTSLDFLKIDVEGHELSVLHGAQNSISRWRPAILVEVAGVIRSTAYRNGSFSDTFEMLEALGYVCWRCDEGKLLPVARDELPDGVGMFVCLHREHHANLVPGLHRAALDYRRSIWWNRFRTLRRAVHLSSRAVVKPRHTFRYLRRASLTDMKSRVRGRL